MVTLTAEESLALAKSKMAEGLSVRVVIAGRSYTGLLVALTEEPGMGPQFFFEGADQKGNISCFVRPHQVLLVNR